MSCDVIDQTHIMQFNNETLIKRQNLLILNPLLCHGAWDGMRVQYSDSTRWTCIPGEGRF